MAKLNDEERKLVSRAQHNMADIKERMQRVEADMSEMMAINYKAGRMREGNAAMRLRDTVMSLRGQLGVAHANASDALCECWEDGPDIVAFGPGGR